MRLRDTLGIATFALRGNWLRSTLTSLGVIIGIAAVIVMVSVGEGTRGEIDRLVSGLGSNRLELSGGSPNTGGVRGGLGNLFSLTEGDAKAIREEVPGVQYVAGSLRGGTQVVHAENNWSTQWQGIQPDFMPVNSWQLANGDGFAAGDYNSANKVAVIGDTVRKQLFGDEDPIGATIRLGRVPFRVVGTLKPKGPGGFGQDQDDIILVPLETARRRLSQLPLAPDSVQQISVGVANASDLDDAQSQIESLLRQRHRIQPGGDDDFRVRNIAQIVATRTQTTRLMSLLLGAVAAISLVVGGIGIMNIMLVSVTERIREIGLRMAVGAGPRAVRAQFLAEAMLISLIGGAIGILIGVVGALLVEKFGALPVALNLRVIGMAAGFSVAIGLFFGYYPARKASLLDPIEALRQQ